MAGFRWDTLVSDETARQQAQPYGIVATPGEFEERDRAIVEGEREARRFFTLRRWRDDGLCERYGEVLGEREAGEVVALAVEYVEQHGYDPDRACWAALGEYQESIAMAGEGQ